MTPDPSILKTRLGSPAAALGFGLVAAVMLSLFSAERVVPVKGVLARLLRPGQTAAVVIRGQAARMAGTVRNYFHDADQLAEARRAVEQLTAENRRLTDRLAALNRRKSNTSNEPPDEDQRLFKARCIEARVLGRQARAFLQRNELLDVGARQGVQPDAPVLEVPSGVIDWGDDADLAAGQFVLSGGRVWGKIVEVRPHTSVVRAVTEPGFRDLVQLAGPSHQGPQGILQGTGEPLARVQLIEVTEPVAVGQLVYSAAGQGVVRQPLLYGRIVRLRRPVGASHWEIWMQPAVTSNRADRVAVLRVELNPTRVAGAAKPP